LEIEFIKKRKRGKQIFYSVNKDLPIFEDLKRIVLKTEGVGSELRTNLNKLGKIKYALIFGSFANGKEIATSDIDILIIGDTKEENLIEAISNIEERIGREVNYILWSEKELKERMKEKHYLLNIIVENPIIGLIGNINEFRKTYTSKKEALKIFKLAKRDLRVARITLENKNYDWSLTILNRE